jgi:uncharacterized membrane protein YgdD (TMEM256/DUF423 family)
MTDKFRSCAALLGFSGVGMGAFGAHALKATLAARGTTASWTTAVSYQMIHALALLAVSTREVDHDSTVPWAVVGNCWIAGSVLFSGSIYGLALGGPRVLGPITPVGGLLLMAGWGALWFGSEGKGETGLHGKVL